MQIVQKSVLIVFTAACLASGCKETRLASAKIESLSEEEPELTFKNINTLYTEDTRPVLRMKAPIQYRYQNGNERYPAGINIEMFNEEGQLKSTLVADSAVYSDSTRTYTVMGNVVVEGLQDRKKLETNLLNWNKETEDIFTDDSVRITEGPQILTGVGLRANQDFSNYEILNPIGSVYVSE